MAEVDFDSLQKEFLGALPSGFEGVKNLALRKVEKISPLAGVQPFANTQEMWYQIFLWCLATSVFIHCISACIAFLALRKHSRGFFFPLLVIFIGFLYPVTGGVITSATIAAVYETSRFTMPRYASFLWGAGQAFIGFLVSYTRVLATL